MPPKSLIIMTQTTTKHGFAIVDKETGWTSHDVVAKARGTFGTKKKNWSLRNTRPPSYWRSDSGFRERH